MMESAHPADVQLSPVEGQEAKDMGSDLITQERRSSGDGETVDQALELQAHHELLQKQAQQSDSVLGMEKYNTAMPVGIRALHKELSAFQAGTFRNMWRGSYYYISKDKMLILTTVIMMLVATVYTFWAPQWVAVAIRLVFTDGEGSIPLSDFCGWLFLYVATLALLWSGSASLLYVLYSRFVQRMRYHFATLGERLYSRDSQIADSMFLERVEADVPQTAAFWFKTMPTAIIAGLSVFMGFVMIFYHSWQVGLTALGLFSVFLLLSMFVDEVALRDASVSADEKRREDALWAKLHDHTTTNQERKECLMQINRIRALRASYGSHGLLHILVGVLYRVLAFCTPVILFLVAGRNVVDHSMDQYQVVVISVYFTYVVLCSFMLNSVIMGAATRIGAGVKLMGFVNETHAGLASRRRSRVQDALGGATADRTSIELRMATPWGVVGLALMFVGITLAVTLLLMQNSSASSCPPVEYTCSMNMDDDWYTATHSGSVSQSFDMGQGCAFDESPNDILNQCAETMLQSESAPKNSGVLPTKMTLTFEIWTGVKRAYSKTMDLPTLMDYEDENMYNSTNYVSSGDSIDLSSQTTYFDFVDPCTDGTEPCGTGEFRRGDCIATFEHPYYYCDCYPEWYGWDCLNPVQDDTGDEVVDNTTSEIDEINRYKQCLNESLPLSPEVEELCDNLTIAVNATRQAVENMVEFYWWSNSHDDEMRQKQADKYRRYYETELAIYEAEQKAIEKHNRRQDACLNRRQILCKFSQDEQQCMDTLEDFHEAICDLVARWLLPKQDVCNRECPQNWNCEISDITCYSCPKAVCVRPREQNIMIPGYHPTFNDFGTIRGPGIVNVGGNASHVIDEFWGTVLADVPQRLIEPRFVAYMCGEFFPFLEVSFPQPMRVISFAVNGWGDEALLQPPTFWSVEGTNDAVGGNRTWTEIGTANSEDWLTEENHLGYPFEDDKIVPANNAGAYQHYRLNVRCSGQASGLLIENWGLFIDGDDPLVSDAFDDEA